MGIGQLPQVLLSRLQLTLLASAASLDLTSQVIWDDAPAVEVVRFREDTTETLGLRLPGPVKEQPKRTFNQQGAGLDWEMRASLAAAPLAVRLDPRTSTPALARPSSREVPSPEKIGWPPKTFNGRSLAPVPQGPEQVAETASTRHTAAATAGSPPTTTTALPSVQGGLPSSTPTLFSVGTARQVVPALAPVTLSGPTPVPVANYPFTGYSLASTDTDPLSTAANLSSTGLPVFGYAIIGNPLPSLWVAASTIPNSLSTSSYLSFSITPNPGYALSLGSFSLDAARVRTGSYTGFFEVRSSVDGFTAAVLSGTITSTSPTFASYSTTLGPSFVNLGSVEFRIYFWDSNDGFRNLVLVDNILVMGSSVVIPEPPSWLAAAALGGVALALGVWRRRVPSTPRTTGAGTPPQRA